MGSADIIVKQCALAEIAALLHCGQQLARAVGDESSAGPEHVETVANVSLGDDGRAWRVFLWRKALSHFRQLRLRQISKERDIAQQ